MASQNALTQIIWVQFQLSNIQPKLPQNTITGVYYNDTNSLKCTQLIKQDSNLKDCPDAKQTSSRNSSLLHLICFQSP